MQKKTNRILNKNNIKGYGCMIHFKNPQKYICSVTITEDIALILIIILKTIALDSFSVRRQPTKLQKNGTKCNSVLKQANTEDFFSYYPRLSSYMLTRVFTLITPK